MDSLAAWSGERDEVESSCVGETGEAPLISELDCTGGCGTVVW